MSRQIKDIKCNNEKYYLCEYLQVNKKGVEKFLKINDNTKWFKFNEAKSLLEKYNTIHFHNDILNELKGIVIPDHLGHLETNIIF